MHGTFAFWKYTLLINGTCCRSLLLQVIVGKYYQKTNKSIVISDEHVWSELKCMYIFQGKGLRRVPRICFSQSMDCIWTNTVNNFLEIIQLTRAVVFLLEWDIYIYIFSRAVEWRNKKWLRPIQVLIFDAIIK